MENYTTKIAMVVVSLAVGAILVMGLLIPTVSSSQIVAGTPVEYTNEGTSAYHYGYYDNVEIVLTSTGTDEQETITVNGTPVSRTTAYNILIYADTFNFIMHPTTSTTKTAWYGYYAPNGDTVAANTLTPGTTTIKCENGTMTYTKTNGDTITQPYTWIVAIKDGGEYVERHNLAGVYINDIKTDYIASGMYTTGNNDTMYYYYNGNAYTYEDYDSKLIVSAENVDNVQNVQKTTSIKFAVNEEQFVPYYSLVKEKIIGSEKNTNTALLGIIPIMGIVALISFAAIGIKNKY